MCNASGPWSLHKIEEGANTTNNKCTTHNKKCNFFTISIRAIVFVWYFSMSKDGYDVSGIIILFIV